MLAVTQGKHRLIGGIVVPCVIGLNVIVVFFFFIVLYATVVFFVVPYATVCINAVGVGY